VHLRKLTISGFRNLAPQELTFLPGPTVIWGENGQGKSNLLEAIILACTGTLWRAGKDVEAIRWGQEIGRVKAEVENAHQETIKTEIALVQNGAPLVKVNDVPRRRGELAGLIPVVAFSGEDLQIIKGDAAQRRRFLNAEISQINRSYRWNLLHYNRALEQRNRLLKEQREAGSRPEALLPWEQALARYGGKLVSVRAKFLVELQERATAHLAQLNINATPLLLPYEPALGTKEIDLPVAQQEPTELEQLLLAGYGRTRTEEINRGFSLLGPHRDDFGLLVAGIDQRMYGSQGQQRSLAVALRLGLAQAVAQANGEAPILLLDDILSELDPGRRRGLVEALEPQGQFLITTPALEEIPQELVTRGRLYRMTAGQAIQT
jgi:DNA replication and repair protein RecF